MHRSTWKAFERRVARTFGVERTPLSGGNSRHTKSDSLHETLYIECKSNVDHPVLNDWNDIRNSAKNYDMAAVVPIVQPGGQTLILWHIDAPPTGDLITENYCQPYYAARDSIITLWRKTLPMAAEERKTPMLAMGQSRRQGFWIGCMEKDVNTILCAM